ncbi:biopolymer transporter ExbB [Endomicrobiia bacterium]|nr:biopolymer transporter ExbB [Endomicrobiia bacterium]
MFEGKSIIDILNMGGWVLYIVLGTSIISISVICLKAIEFWLKSKVRRTEFVKDLIGAIKKGRIDEAMYYCDRVNSPMANVSKAGLIAFKEKEESIEAAMKREIMIQTVKLEGLNTILATLGSTTVYIGLVGTVIGIIGAFNNISRMGSGGLMVVIGGVSEALINTAAGLLVAIPATVAYNFFSKSVDKFVVDMEYCVSAVEENLKRK